MHLLGQLRMENTKPIIGTNHSTGNSRTLRQAVAPPIHRDGATPCPLHHPGPEALPGNNVKP